jgi:hypothetical protein
MKILLVAATRAEIEPFLTHFSFSDVPPHEKTIRNYQIKVLVTGAGMVPTAFSLGKAFSEEHFDLAINFDIKYFTCHYCTKCYGLLLYSILFYKIPIMFPKNGQLATS